MATSIAPWGSTPLDNDQATALLHDIRGFLTIIRGQCHGVVRDGRADHATIDRLRIIDHEVTRIAEAIDQVREVVRSGADRLTPPIAIDLRQSAQRAVNRVGGAAQARQVTVRMVAAARSMCILAHPDQIDRVLDNVLLNAISACGAGGSVGLALDRGTHEVTLCITNGIDQATAEHGWGVGLQIVRDIVQRAGGTVAFSQERDRATLWLAFPAVPGREPA